MCVLTQVNFTWSFDCGVGGISGFRCVGNSLSSALAFVKTLPIEHIFAARLCSKTVYNCLNA